MVEETLTITITLTDAHRQMGMDLLCTAVESSYCGHWAEFESAERDASLNYLSVRVRDSANDDEDVPFRTITALDMVHAVPKLAARNDLQNQYALAFCAKAMFHPAYHEHDGPIANMVLQMALFGDLVYA